MDLNVTRRDNAVILQASGRLDSNSAPAFEEACRRMTVVSW